jgi:hypothetical protein
MSAIWDEAAVASRHSTPPLLTDAVEKVVRGFGRIMIPSR